MTGPADFAQALTEIDTALANGVTAASDSPEPFTALVAIIDQIRMFVGAGVQNLAQEAAAGPPAPAGATGTILWCSQCLGDAMRGQAAGKTDLPVRAAVTVLGGQAICNVPPHSIIALSGAAAAAAARGEQVTAAGIVLASGAVPRVGG